MTKLRIALLLLSIGTLSFSACVKTVTYVAQDNPIRSLLNKGTTDDVTKQIGPPTASRKLSDGGEVWSYDYRSTITGAGQDGTSSATTCRRLILVFDQAGILRDYHRENC